MKTTTFAVVLDMTIDDTRVQLRSVVEALDPYTAVARAVARKRLLGRVEIIDASVTELSGSIRTIDAT